MTSAMIDRRNRIASAARRNLLINGGFLVWQRGSSSTSTVDDTYCLADRWYVLTQTAAVNVSQIDAPENGARYGLRLSQAQSAAQRMGIAQIIETKNCTDSRGDSVALSGRVRC